MIVVGMGPVGCVSAAVLANRGLEVSLLEASPELPLELRASTFHPATLDLLDDLDVTADLVARGLIAQRFAYRDRHTGTSAVFDLDTLSDVTRHPYRLQCEQYKLCELLIQRLDDMSNVSLRFSSEVVSAQDHNDYATVQLVDGTLLSADFVVAADGASSAVRKSLGIDFDGMTYEDRYLVVSTPHDYGADFDDLCPVNYLTGPDEWLVLLRTPTL